MASHLALWVIFFSILWEIHPDLRFSAFILGVTRRRPSDNQTAKRFWFAQGIEAVSFFACGKKDTSGKPGPATQVAGCAQK
jgi:hypothetical protein